MKPTGSGGWRFLFALSARLFGKGGRAALRPLHYRLTLGNVRPRRLPFDQLAAHNRGREFARQAAVKTSELLDGYKFRGGDVEGTALDQLLELLYSHLVQAAGHLAEPRCPIRLKGGSPADKSFFTEY